MGEIKKALDTVACQLVFLQNFLFSQTSTWMCFYQIIHEGNLEFPEVLNKNKPNSIVVEYPLHGMEC